MMEVINKTVIRIYLGNNLNSFPFPQVQFHDLLSWANLMATLVVQYARAIVKTDLDVSLSKIEHLNCLITNDQFLGSFTKIYVGHG